MARMISGKITDRKGSPLQGLRAQAWVDDWPDGCDLMGEAITDMAGEYSIICDGCHWDPVSYGNSSPRHNIFVTLQASTAGMGWAHVAKSRVYENHELRHDLLIDMEVAVNPGENEMTPLSPSVHGFRFDNRFTVEPSLLGLELGSWNMGLCGGMSAAVVSRFNHGTPIPSDTVPPNQDSPLFRELLERQVCSLPTEIIHRIYDWQSAPDEDHWNRKHGVGYRTKREWPRLKAELDADRPAQLVLIRVEGYLANISKNHQVVAIGYAWNPFAKDLRVYVYDPNDHGNTNALSMNLGLPGCRLDATDTTGKRLRGFFLNTAGPAAAL